MKFSDLVRSLDYLAPDVTLNVNGKSSVKTYLGSVLWLLSTGCFIASMVFSVSSFISTSNPSFSIEVANSKAYPRMELRKSRLIPILLVYLDEVTAIPAEEVPQYATFLMQQITYKAAKDSKDYTTEYQNHQFQPCSSFPTTEGMEPLTLEFGLCIDPAVTLHVEGRTSDPYNALVYFGAYPCTLDDASLCKPVEDVKRIGFNYFTGEASLNLNIYDTPVSFELSGHEFIFLEPGLNFDSLYKLRISEVKNAEQLFKPAETVAEYSEIESTNIQMFIRDPNQISCTLSQINNLECYAYVGKLYSSGGRRQTYIRSYMSLVQLVGDLGGAREFIYTIAIVIYYFYHQRAEKRYLLKHIMGLDMGEITQKQKQLAKPDKEKLDQAVEQATSLIEHMLDVVTIGDHHNKVEIISECMLTQQQQENAAKISMAKYLRKNSQLKSKNTQELPSLSGKRPLRDSLRLNKPSRPPSILVGKTPWSRHSFRDIDFEKGKAVSDYPLSVAEPVGINPLDRATFQTNLQQSVTTQLEGLMQTTTNQLEILYGKGLGDQPPWESDAARTPRKKNVVTAMSKE